MIAGWVVLGSRHERCGANAQDRKRAFVSSNRLYSTVTLLLSALLSEDYWLEFFREKKKSSNPNQNLWGEKKDLFKNYKDR